MNKIDFKKLNKKGFSVVEVLLSVAIFALLVTGLVGVVIYGQETSSVSGKRARAVLVAEEGLEAVRNIRDEDFANLVDGTYGLAVSGNQWIFSGSSDTTDVFTRAVTISTVDSSTKQVTSQVTWDQTAQRSGIAELTTYLTDWASVSSTFRVTEYFLDLGEYTGTSYDLTLDQDLEDNYFVIVQGSAGDGSGGGGRGPDANYIALTADPDGTGDLSTSGSSDVLSFDRGASSDSWVGTITVAECLADCDASGFELLDVVRATHSGNDTSGNEISGTAWGSGIDQIMLMGGFNGAGCDTSEGGSGDTKVCHARIYPAGTDEIVWTRDSGGASLSTAISTIMVLDWGSEWEVQRERITGNNGGGGANSTGDYDTETISSVDRDNTWVWGTGHTDDNGIGDAAEGSLITLGDGVNQNSTETEIAVGQEYTDDKDFEVYALTHDDLAVDYRFKADGDRGSITYDVTVDTASTATGRMSLVYNGCNGTGTAYPRPIFSSHYDDDNTVRLQRRRSGQNWPAWVQGIDFSGI